MRAKTIGRYGERITSEGLVPVKRKAGRPKKLKVEVKMGRPSHRSLLEAMEKSIKEEVRDDLLTIEKALLQQLAQHRAELVDLRAAGCTDRMYYRSSMEKTKKDFNVERVFSYLMFAVIWITLFLR